MRSIRNVFGVATAALWLAVGMQAQERGPRPPMPWWKKIRPAAELSMQVSGSSSYVFLGPYAFYQLLPRLEAGAGAQLWYYWLNYLGTLYSGSIYGPFTKVHWQPLASLPIFLAYHEEWLFVPDDYYTPGQRKLSHNLMVGGGYKNQFGRGWMRYSYISVLVNLTYNTYSPYATPLVVRFGVVF